jgi:WD40 repeat protein
VTADGNLVSGSDDQTVKLWDLARGELLKTLEGHSSSVTSVAVTADGKLVSGSLDATVNVWDLGTCSFVTHLYLDAGILYCACAPGGSHIVAGDEAGGLHFLRLEGRWSQTPQ